MDFTSPNLNVNFNEAGNSDGAATPKASATKRAAFETSDVFVHDPDSPFYIFFGTYKDASGSAPVPAVCKLALQSYQPFRDNKTDSDNLGRLLREAGYYKKQLKELQGVVVPEFYGYYEGRWRRSNKEEFVACIVLQNCGVPLCKTDKLTRINQELYAINDEQLADELINKVLRIHREAGLAILRNPHNMLGVGFVWRKGQDGDEIRYVGFSHAMEHVCQVKLSHFYRHALDLGPGNYDFRCAELANVGRVFRWLTPGYLNVPVGGYEVFHHLLWGSKRMDVMKGAEMDEEDEHDVGAEEEKILRVHLVNETCNRYMELFGTRDPKVVCRYLKWHKRYKTITFPLIMDDEFSQRLAMAKQLDASGELAQIAYDETQSYLTTVAGFCFR